MQKLFKKVECRTTDRQKYSAPKTLTTGRYTHWLTWRLDNVPCKRTRHKSKIGNG